MLTESSVPHATSMIPVQAGQAVAGALVVVCGVLVAVVGWRARAGGLTRNRWAGVRTPATLASDQAFLVGNRVASPFLLAAGGIAVVLGPVLAFAPSLPSFAVLLTITLAGTAGLVLTGGVLGSLAAQRLPVGVATRPSPCAGCACGGPGTAACAR